MDLNFVVVVLAILALVTIANGHTVLAEKIIDLQKGLFYKLLGPGDESDDTAANQDNN